MAIEEDELPESSTGTMVEEPAQPAVDAAADSEVVNETATPGGEQGSDQPAGGLAAKPVKQSKPSDEPTGPLAKALDHLAEKPKNKGPIEKPGQQPAAKKPEATPAVKTDGQPKVQAAKKDAAKPSVVEPTAEELQAMPERTRKRFESLLGERKHIKAEHEKLSAEYEQAKPDIERGKVFGAIVEEFGLASDLADSDDEDVAGAVIFQAALTRLVSGKGTKSDLEQVNKQYANLNATMERLGLGAAAKAPAIDVDAFQKALDRAHNDLEFGDLRKLVDGLKAPAKTEVPPPAPAKPALQLVDEQPRQPQQQQAQPAAHDEDDAFYQAKGAQALIADGITDTKAYFTTTLYPRILADLKAAYPGRNPVDVFRRLSPQAKHDASIGAHQAIRKQNAALKPAQPKPAPQQRANAAGGSRPAWQQSVGAPTTAKAAIDRLSGD